jgi:hypothetical protein
MPKFDLIQQGVTPVAPVAADPVAPPPPPELRRRTPQRSSKRNSRKLSGFYLTEETAAKLRRHVFERQAAGEKIDASDVVESLLADALADPPVN